MDEKLSKKKTFKNTLITNNDFFSHNAAKKSSTNSIIEQRNLLQAHEELYFDKKLKAKATNKDLIGSTKRKWK